MFSSMRRRICKIRESFVQWIDSVKDSMKSCGRALLPQLYLGTICRSKEGQEGGGGEEREKAGGEQGSYGEERYLMEILNFLPIKYMKF